MAGNYLPQSPRLKIKANNRFARWFSARRSPKVIGSSPVSVAHSFSSFGFVIFYRVVAPQLLVDI